MIFVVAGRLSANRWAQYPRMPGLMRRPRSTHGRFRMYLGHTRTVSSSESSQPNWPAAAMSALVSGIDSWRPTPNGASGMLVMQPHELPRLAAAITAFLTPAPQGRRSPEILAGGFETNRRKH
jgi:hypothetical protein